MAFPTETNGLLDVSSDQSLAAGGHAARHNELVDAVESIRDVLGGSGLTPGGGVVVSCADGSAAAPSVTNSGDTDTGIYFPAADQVAITTGGTAAATFAAGAIANPTITGVASFPDGSASAPSITNTGDTNTGMAFPADDTVILAGGAVERLRVQSGLPGVAVNFNAIASVQTGLTDPPVMAITSGVSTNRAMLTLQQYRSTGTTCAVIEFLKSKSSTIGTNTTVASGDRLGRIGFSGADGTGFVLSSEIRAVADTTVATGDVPGRLSMFTRAAAGSLTERVRVDSAGLLTGTGTSLGAWTAYTPTLGGTGWAIGDGTASGYYCQIGKVVFFKGIITFGSTSTYGANRPEVSFPTTLAATNYKGSIGVVARDVSLSVNYELAGIPFSTSLFILNVKGASGALSSVSSSAPFTWATSDTIEFFGTYQAA